MAISVAAPQHGAGIGAAGQARTSGTTKDNHENSGAREAGGRLQRQDPRQGGRLRRRARQREDVDESVRRDRRRGGGPPEGSRQGDRNRRRLDRPGAGRRDASAPRSPWAPTAASWSRPTARSSRWRWPRCSRRIVDEETARPRHPGQAGDRRRLQSDRPDAGGAARLAAGHLRLQDRDRRRQRHGDPRGRRRAADGEARSCRRSSPPTCASTSRATPRCPTS